MYYLGQRLWNFYSIWCISQNCPPGRIVPIASHQSFHPADLLALSIFWTHGRTRVWHQRWGEGYFNESGHCFSPVEHRQLHGQNQHVQLQHNWDISYHPLKGLVPQLLRKGDPVNWPPSSHLTKYQEPSIDSQPLQSLYEPPVSGRVCKENLSMGDTHLFLPLWDLPPTTFTPRTYLFMKLSNSWLMYAGATFYEVWTSQVRGFFWGGGGDVGSFI